jgi:thioesterase domain-containing protein
MAACYVEEIRKVQPEGPYFLSGRCFGGVVAFEMAQQLLAHGQRTAFLGMIDTIFPPGVFHDLEQRKKSRPVGHQARGVSGSMQDDLCTTCP